MMKLMRLGLAGVMLAMMTACTVGPDFEAPEINAPERFVTQELLNSLNAGKESAEFPVNWWEGFGDPLLSGLVDDALNQNYRLAAAAARLESAQGVVKRVGADNKPTVTASGGGDYTLEERLDIKQEDPEKIRTGFGRLAVLLPLDVFGRTRRSVEAARANVAAAESELRGLVLEVSADVTREYLTLRGNQRQLALLEESVALQEKTLAIVKSRFDTGLAPELDLRRAETSVERLRAGVPRLKRDLLNSRNRLATLTGQYPGALEEALKSEQELPSYQSPVAEVVPFEVLMRRPDVKQAEAELHQAVALIGVTTADLYPSFELAAVANVSALKVNNLSTVELLVASAGGTIQQVLYEGGARRANVAIAKAEAEAALNDYRQVLLDASEEVERALAALEASRVSQISLEKAVISSGRSFNQAEGLYQQGLISFLDVVDAQRQLADAEQALASERTNYATQIAALFRALGTPVNPVAESEAESE